MSETDTTTDKNKIVEFLRGLADDIEGNPFISGGRVRKLKLFEKGGFGFDNPSGLVGGGSAIILYLSECEGWCPDEKTLVDELTRFAPKTSLYVFADGIAVLSESDQQARKELERVFSHCPALLAKLPKEPISVCHGGTVINWSSKSRTDSECVSS